ncbi:MAG TPA: cryptochrome/photolyase family protein [Burkholderiaceae bacterium]|nr:cryptochrome/photolyase family protein [Burkholderiaceae bacterium]
MRHLIIVLGDQLDLDAAAFDGFDATADCVWMAEASEESTHVWSAKPRIALFLSAMRHFADTLREAGRPLDYTRLDDAGAAPSLAALLAAAIRRHRPLRLVMTAPGDWRVLQSLTAAAAKAGVPLEVREDRHFYGTVREFAAYAKGRRQLRMEFFYREMRRRHRILMRGDSPAGGQWNFDADNRQAFGPAGPVDVPLPRLFEPDAITREVIDLIERRFAGHPGSLAHFSWPVTRIEALAALDDFIVHRLPQFGCWQDALWGGEPWLWHSRLSAALNLKLLHPREAVAAAEAAWVAGQVPLPGAEGFIRQVLGWREYVRGVYWTQMPGYLEHNALHAHEPLPSFYWTGTSDMVCLADAIGQTLAHGYAHHIQRLMVTGLYALLLGVAPKQLHEWYLAVYVDAVEWVELPNTLGMSQAADGGLMASKPYAASGRYIERMSGGSLCRRCRYRPSERTGPGACPFTLLYWDFLLRHQGVLARNPRMALPLRHLARMTDAERDAIRAQAGAWRAASAREAAASARKR